MGTAAVGVAGSEQQGTLISLGVDVKDGLLRNVGFRAFACPHIISACNDVAEGLEGLPPEALLEIDALQLQAKFGIPVEKAGKLLILKDAARACYDIVAAGPEQGRQPL
jgi:hypothetical protein